MNIYLHRQFKAFIVAAWVVASGCGTEQPAVKGHIPPGDYVVLEGDDLSNVALRAYGDVHLCFSLLNANRELSKRPGFDLTPGETIKIPARADVDRSRPKPVFPQKLPADYIVMPGDSLPSIAQGCYGNRGLWLQIYEANRSVLSEKVKEKPHMLIAGQVLRIPKLAPSDQNAGSGN